MKQGLVKLRSEYVPFLVITKTSHGRIPKSSKCSQGYNISIYLIQNWQIIVLPLGSHIRFKRSRNLEFGMYDTIEFHRFVPTMFLLVVLLHQVSDTVHEGHLHCEYQVYKLPLHAKICDPTGSLEWASF